MRVPELEAASGLVDYLESRASRPTWRKFDPSFAASVHSDIYDRALAGMADDDLQTVKSASLNLDVNVLAYDPRDHFDFAYIPEGWKRVAKRLATGKIEDFGKATHSIADFYAHSFYGQFADRRPDGSIAPYDPARPLEAKKLIYDFANLALPGCSKTFKDAEQLWNGKLISGQWWRWFSTYPKELHSKAELGPRRCLPDHDVLAVDEPTPSGKNALYRTKNEYQEQFKLRRNAAAEHVRNVYLEWKK